MNVIIKDAVEKSQNDFYLAFKNRMTQIMKDMQKLKEKANVERIKAQQDQKLVNIEKERDWFRAEALKLNKIQKQQHDQLTKYKDKIDSLTQDVSYFQTQLYEEKLNSKQLYFENEKIKLDQLKKLFNNDNKYDVDRDDTQMKQSVESIKRLGKELLQIEQSDAVKEYKFITQQIKDIDSNDKKSRSKSFA